MSAFMDSAIERASKLNKTICFPEGDDPRTIEAVKIIKEKNICNPVVLYEDQSKNDPEITALIPELTEGLFKLREKKGMTPEQAAETIKNPMYLAMMLVKTGRVDGVVAGACHSTSDTLRAALQVVKTAPGTPLVSAFFIECVPNCEYGANGTFIFADSGLNVDPSEEELAHIAIQSANSFKQLVGAEPKVAMLSHSTMGSAKNDLQQKMVNATAKAKELAPDLAVDGEMQFDAAVVKSVADSKAPGSEVAGNANVLIFPNLDAGNIGYKLVQRLAKAEAYGPITQGLAAPVNDLSRGCSAEDIAGVAAITAIQAEK